MKAYHREALALPLVFAIPGLAFAVGAVVGTPLRWISAVCICWAVAAVIVVSQKGELMRFRRSFLVLYSGVGIIGLSCPFIGLMNSLVGLMVIGGAGTAVLWMPGAMRVYALVLFYPARYCAPGLAEGALLQISFAPHHIQSVADARRFTFGVRTALSRAKDVVSGELALSVLVHVLYNSQNLAAATLSRGFRLNDYRPRVRTKSLELAFYYLAMGGLICLLIM